MQAFAKLLTSISVGLAVFSTTAMADNLLTGGAICQPKLAAGSHIGYNYLGVYNSGSAPETIECPFTMKQDYSLNVNSVEAYVYDRNSAADINCKLYGIAPSGAQLWASSFASAGSGTGPQWLLAIMNEPSIGTIHMECVLPGKQGTGVSAVSTIQVNITN